MLLTLRGLPPDIEVSDIRSYIHGLCAVGQVIIDELAPEAGGTRRVTLATMSDADAVTLRHALSGERLGTYTLRVDTYQRPDASGFNFRDNGGPGDHGRYVKKATDGSVGFSGNSNLNFGHLGDVGVSSGRGGHSFGGLIQNSERGGSGFSGFGENYQRDDGGFVGVRRNSGRDSAGLGGQGVSHGIAGAGLGGLRGNNGRERGAFGDFGGTYKEDRDGLGGQGGSHGREGAGFGDRRENNGRDRGAFDGFRGTYEGDRDVLGGQGGSLGREGIGFGDLRENNGRDRGAFGGFGGTYERDRDSLGGQGESDGRDGAGLGGLRRKNGRDKAAFDGFRGTYEGDRDVLGGQGGSHGREGTGFGDLRENNGRDRGAIAGFGGTYERDRDSLGVQGGSHGREGAGFGGRRENKVRGEVGGGLIGNYEGGDGLGGHGGSYGRHGGGLGGNNLRDSVGFGGHGGQFQGRGNEGLGKRYRGEDSINESNTKRRRDSSERDASFGSGVTSHVSRGRDIGGYSAPNKSLRGGPVEYNDANHSRDSDAFKDYNRDREPNSYSGGSGLRGHNAMGEQIPYSNDNRMETRKVPPWEQNSAPDSRQSFGNGSGLSSGKVPPWIAGSTQVAAERPRRRSRFSAIEVSSRESARGTERFDRQPADRAPPLHSFRGTQPTAANQQREPPFKQPVPRVINPWADPDPVPQLTGLGALHIPFVINPLQQLGLGLQQTQPQFNQSIQPMGTRSQHNQSTRNFENSVLNKIQSQKLIRPVINKPFSGNMQSIKGQTFSKLPGRSREPDSKFDTIYKIKATHILGTIVDLYKINPNNRSNATLFINHMKNLIEKRLRALTNEDPFKRDLVSIYRNAYSASSDEETMKSVCKQLSLTEIPVACKASRPDFKALEKTKKLEHILKSNFTDIAKYVNPNIKVDADTNKTMEDSVKAETFRAYSAVIIANQLLKPDEKAHNSKLDLEELRLRHYLTNAIDAELAKFPQKEVFLSRDVNGVLRLYHEKTDPDRNRQLIDMAIENCNVKEKNPYKGKFTKPEKAAMAMELWPDLYLKPGQARRSPANIPESRKKARMYMWMDYASSVIASEVFVRIKAEYQKHEADICVDDVQHRVRLWLQERLKDLVPTDTSRIVSTHSLIALYRRAYSEDTDAELIKGVIKERLKELAARRHTFRKTTVVVKLMTSAATKLANEAAYGRQITRDEREQLTQPQTELLVEMQKVIRQRSLKILTQKNARVPNDEFVCTEYRKKYPKRTDSALVKSVINDLEMRAPEKTKPVKEARDQGATEQAHVPINEDEISESKMEGWREACVCRVADEVLYGRVMNRRERDALSLDAQEKLKAARQMVRDQFNEIIASNRGALPTVKALQYLYRNLHPSEQDAALKERVMGTAVAAIKEREIEGEKPEEISVSTMAAWRDAVMCHIADEVLFGEVLTSTQRKSLSLDAQRKIKLARAIVRKQLEDILAAEHREVNCMRDLQRLYREVHRAGEDAALKERVVREGREEELKAAAEFNKKPAEDQSTEKVVDLTKDEDINIILDNQDENEAICQQSGQDGKPNEGALDDFNEMIDLTADTIEGNTNLTTDEIEDHEMETIPNEIEDNVDLASYDIEVNEDDLEDY